MPRLPLLAALALLAAPLAGCGGSDDYGGDVEDTGETGLFGRAQEMAAAVEQMEETANQAPAEPVDFRRLRDLLPETLVGLERTDVEGAKQGSMGFSISEASADYGAGDSTVSVKVTDMGAVPAMGMMGAAWTMTDVDRETATGYEKTVRLGESKGYRTYDTGSRRGEFSLVVADRFLVNVTGRGVDDADLEAALRAVDLSALAAMRDDGRQEA
ncbi:hypothetical protein RQM47_00130 [Rubrivirga sp. S365]|uniref:hypothetical protein n=1 Tax=Rubrivirga sp. S365 TaxID=3076080 RepID=UPI0028C7C2F3|nr:hypothetical protein [Rubrivirga sp. S365]MDT7855042.1 hypothetical protein [Rubrivirga sp. S365]